MFSGSALGVHPYGEEVCLWGVYWERPGGCTPMERRSVCGMFIGSAQGAAPLWTGRADAGVGSCQAACTMAWAHPEGFLRCNPSRCISAAVHHSRQQSR